MTKTDAVNKFNNSKLDDKGKLWIWILVQIKKSFEAIKEGAFGRRYFRDI